LAIFDLDGTLCDTRADIADALNRALGEQGVPALPLERVTEMIGGGVELLVARALGDRAPEKAAEVAARFRANYAAGICRQTALYPGMSALCERARSCGVTLAIATNKPTRLARDLLVGLGILPWFSVVLGEEPGRARKPDRAVVDEILRWTKVSSEHALYVGDSLVDLETARNAGVAVALVDWGYADPAALTRAGADFWVHSADELGRVLGVP
jgi:phosphoglycolate phosphatase